MSNARNLADLISGNYAIAGEVADGSITALKLATDSVTTVKLAATSVTEAKIGTGAVSATKLANTLDLSGKTLTLPSGLIPAAGKVLQVQSSTIATQITTSSSTFVTSGLAVNITPTSATSTVLVMVLGGSAKAADTTTLTVTVYRGGTNIGHSTAGLATIRGAVTVPHAVSIRDTPAVNTALTYTAYFRGSGAVSFNETTGCPVLMLAIELAA